MMTHEGKHNRRALLRQHPTSGVKIQCYCKAKGQLQKMSETEDKLRGMLSDEILQLFEEYVDKSNEFSCISSANSYVTGFRHGSRFTYDAFIDE